MLDNIGIMKLFKQVTFFILFLAFQLNSQENEKYIKANGIVENYSQPAHVFGVKEKKATGESYKDVIIKFVWNREELKSNIKVMKIN